MKYKDEMIKHIASQLVDDVIKRNETEPNFYNEINRPEWKATFICIKARDIDKIVAKAIEIYGKV